MHHYILIDDVEYHLFICSRDGCISFLSRGAGRKRRDKWIMTELVHDEHCVPNILGTQSAAKLCKGQDRMLHTKSDIKQESPSKKGFFNPPYLENSSIHN